MKTTLKALSITLVVLLAGCAGEPVKKSSTGVFDDLYDGKSETAFATELPAESTEQAMVKGDMALRKGDTDLAIYRYVQALELDPRNVGAYHRLGSIHLDRNNFVRAEKAFRMGLAVEPQHAGLHEGLGLLLLKIRRYDEAEESLWAAIEQDDKRWRSYLSLGVMADLKGEYVQAQGYYHQALEIRPGSPQILNNIGYSHYLAGNLDTAVTFLRKALAHNPDYGRAWRNLGLVHARKGDYQRAVEAFSRVDEERTAYNNVGYILMKEDRPEEARHYLRQAIKASPVYYDVANENLANLAQPAPATLLASEPVPESVPE